jgi:hypothetical protein
MKILLESLKNENTFYLFYNKPYLTTIQLKDPIQRIGLYLDVVSPFSVVSQQMSAGAQREKPLPLPRGSCKGRFFFFSVLLKTKRTVAQKSRCPPF